MVSAQNAEQVIITHQSFKRLPGAIALVEAEEHVLPQAQFGGRQKMYGDLRAENLR